MTFTLPIVEITSIDDPRRVPGETEATPRLKVRPVIVSKLKLLTTGEGIAITTARAAKKRMIIRFFDDMLFYYES